MGLTYRMAHSYLPTGPATLVSGFKRRRSSRPRFPRTSASRSSAGRAGCSPGRDDQCRARTYACCFALENDDHLWESYGSDGTRGKVAVVFDFAWLRQHINAQLAPDVAKLYWQGVRCRQIFSINYGIVDYVDWDQHQFNAEHLPNPILYTYLKAVHFSAERELRVSLSAIGMGKLAFGDQVMDLPTSLQAPCDFRAGLAEGGLRSIEIGPDCDVTWLEAELAKLGIGSAPASAA